MSTLPTQAGASPAPSEIADAARVVAWARSNPRKPAATAFTAGPERQAAYWIEWVEDSAAPLYASQLAALCAALGWQGGTFHQVLAEVKRLAAPQAAQPETVRVPTCVPEAKAMALVAIAWLREHAPSELRPEFLAGEAQPVAPAAGSPGQPQDRPATPTYLPEGQR